MKICIGSDHKGFKYKKTLIEFLKKKGYEVTDFGTLSEEATDYPIYAFKVGESVRDKENELGILICGTGIGMSIACNKVKGVRCAKVSSKEEAYLTRFHNNANVIALSSNLSFSKLKKIVITFLEVPFSNEERHIRRIEMIENYD